MYIVIGRTLVNAVVMGKCNVGSAAPNGGDFFEGYKSWEPLNGSSLKVMSCSQSLYHSCSDSCHTATLVALRSSLAGSIESSIHPETKEVELVFVSVASVWFQGPWQGPGPLSRTVVYCAQYIVNVSHAYQLSPPGTQLPVTAQPDTTFLFFGRLSSVYFW